MSEFQLEIRLFAENYLSLHIYMQIVITKNRYEHR